jgi:hypothetical protein
MKNVARLISILLVSVFFMTDVARVAACGPSSVVPVFAFEQRPDERLENFARGELGVVQNGYYRSFLYAAYRHFNNAPFSAREQQDLVSVWRAELYREDANETTTNEAVKTWIDARKKVLTDEPKIYTTRRYDNGYFFFPNCTADAFRTAAKTLENRIAAHGATDENVKNWTRGQDAVFANCAEGKVIPEAADAPAWLKNDRDYQIAAATFYAADFDAARARFEQIAATRDSVWTTTANYLVARTLIRQASLLEDDDAEKLRERRRPFYERAEGQLQKILTDAAMRDFHQSAARLVNLVKYRLRPAERVHELASVLSNAAPNENLRQDLIDYVWLSEKFGGENATKNADATNPREDDLTDWILTFEEKSDAAFRRSLARWRETNATAWFVAALAKAPKDAAEISRLLQDAERVARSSPAFGTIAFHQIRLLNEKGLRGEARAKLDSILNDKNLNLPFSARNRFLSQRMFLAETLDDFLIFAGRRAIVFATDGSPGEIETFSEEALKEWETGKQIARWRDRTMFDVDAARAFNEQMPLAVLKQAAASQKLPEYLRRNLLVAAWTRAVALENYPTADEIAPELARVAPEYAQLFSQYAAAKSSVDKQTAATYLLLKLPALRPNVETGYGRLTPIAEIDSYRDNWWCAPEDFSYNENGEKIASQELPAPSFLTAAQIAEARRERAALKKLGGGSTYLARRATEFATRTPQDARLAESLHLAVRATRYGCQDCETGKLSKAAHDILKNRFPRSEWARKTPYWFKDESCETKAN